ncbi:hypothetical protein MKZ38_008883 [Zalerion maritima]|uniref:Protein arginine methyltransferase NDUFAF7 n=1 Tax=Zalerion maritima TaxID=339359 RepID=A0AAD5RTY7_9PEZI|nr:hypothetical protein MKZ38_008883 [Zalerion maritima]
MDSPLVSQLFRRLFQHAQCEGPQSLVRTASMATTSRSPHSRYPQIQQRRTKSTGRNESSWQQRSLFLPLDKEAEFQKYPIVTAQQLRMRRERPKRVKMLMRDFIEDSLYNPYYGYFSKQAVIFTPGEPFDFNSMRDQPEFYQALGERYVEFEDALDAKEYNETRQLWHTPTEVFSPHYGEAIGRYLLSNYLASLFPYHDLIIYEIGAGRGTLMLNILDYLREVEPSVYARTQYRIIEISTSLAEIQRTRVAAAEMGHADRVEVVNRSIFDWDEYVSSPCFFLAMEVFDNFAHDCIRYDMETEEPMQGLALIDEKGDFYEFYERNLDKWAARFFRVRHAATGGIYPTPFPQNRWMKMLAQNSPFRANLSQPEYLPIRLLQFFDILEKYFPAHRLVTSDFHALPNACPGLNAPLVQTRYQRTTVPVVTPLVHQGYFDILFPTDFITSEALYQAITGKLTKVMSHEDFMRRWAFVEDTETQSGENPLLSWYQNASVMLTV